MSGVPTAPTTERHVGTHNVQQYQSCSDQSDRSDRNSVGDGKKRESLAERWRREAQDEKHSSCYTECFSHEPYKPVATHRNGRNDASPVGTGRNGRNGPEILGFERSDDEIAGRSSRNGPDHLLEVGTGRDNSAWGFTPEQRGAELARFRPAPPKAYPLEWSAGVAALVRSIAPPSIDQDRWIAFGLSAAAMIDGHGEQLHAVGWRDLDLFGLHAEVLERRPDCLCLAWLLHRRTITEVAVDRVALTSAAGVTVSFTRSRPGLAEPRVLAWNLGTHNGGASGS